MTTSVESQKTDKLKLLERLLEKKGIAVARDRKIPRRTKPGPVELSYAQERLWFLEQMDGAVAAYNNAMALRLKGRVNVAALEQSIGEVRRRHESLRTIFSDGDGHPVQIITDADRLAAPLVDMRELSTNEAETTAVRVTSREAYARFDLSRGPVMRLRLIQRGPLEYVLLLTVHHIASDGRSFEVLVREVVSLYEAFSRGERSALNELPIQYADYAVWQRGRLRGEVLTKQLSYWEQRLGDGVPPLNLPADRPRPAANSFRGSRESFVISASRTSELAAMARREKTTLFVVLLAAFNVLLSRYTGQDDVIVGAPIANRDRAEIEGLIGFFVNAIVLRGDLSGSPSFRQLVDRVSRESLGAYANQELPFELLVDHLKPERDAASTPLFQVCFVLQEQSQGTMRLRDLEATPLEISRKATKFDLTVEVIPVDDHLIAEFTYSTDRFDMTTIRRMGAHFVNVLKSTLASPDSRLSNIELLSAGERHSFLTEWSDSRNESGVEFSIHQVFERCVLEFSDSIAVACRDELISYSLLNQRANQLAHHLTALNVALETGVGVCMHRSIDLIVALLAILKAGGVYVPLDPDYPSERLAFMIDDANVTVLLTSDDLLNTHGELDVRTISVDFQDEGLMALDRSNPETCAGPGNIAYVMYTSGSTGIPKGSAIPHRAVVRLVKNTDYISFSPEEVFLHFAPLSFDASTIEIWGPLLNGGRLVISPTGAHSLEELGDLLKRYDVSTLWLTSGLFTQVVESQIESLSGVRQLLSGGDVLSVPHVAKALRELKGCKLINGYGPTENTTFTCCHEITASDNTEAIPIGRPIANTQVCVLDSDLQPVPVRARGQLFVYGAGLSRGYINRADLTASKFIPNPFCDEPGSRMYSTGDVVSFLPGGRISFMGRIDQMVKIRGFRIEPGEVETALGQHSEVREAVVVARKMANDGKRLVAYVTPKREPGPGSESLRRFLQSKLPNHMVPSLFISVDQFPLTPNGKIDLESLSRLTEPEPDIESGTGYVAPRTPVEKLLSTIWAEVLGVKQVGIDDNFFHLGGDSILSIQIVARANQSGVRLRPQQIFQHQTIEALAGQAESNIGYGVSEGETVTGDVPLTPIQLWFLEQNLPNPSHFNQAVMAGFREEFSPVALDHALRSLAVHHAALRHRFVKTDFGWRQTCCEPAGNALLTRIDLSAIRGDSAIDEATKKLACELQASLDISMGRLIRVALFDLGPGRASRLLIIIHHLVVDGVSWRILMDDLLTAYQQARRSEPIQLPASTASYKRWAERLKQQAQSASQSSIEYWLKTPWERAAPLPRDYPEGANVEGSTSVVTASLSPEHTRALLREVPAVFHTQINDVLITALAHAFSRWTGQDWLLLSLEGHGREEIVEGLDISRTVGWFTSIFPVLIGLGEGVNTVEALMSVKEQLGRIPYGGAGFGVTRYLGEDPDVRRLREIPAPELSFNYLGQFDQFLSDSSLFAPTQEFVGPLHGLLGKRNHLIDINASVLGGRLELRWTYSENIHRRTTIQRLAQSHLDALMTLINHREQHAVVRSDTPFTRLDQHAIPAVAGSEIEDVYGLTGMQHGMLVHTQRVREAGMYVNQVSYRLEGALSVTALRQAWQSVIDRHAIWRTGFVWEGLDEPLQVVHKRAELSWNESDWRGVDPEEREEKMNLELQSDFSREFNLSKPPLMRVSLIRLAENTHQFIWSFHHLVMDGWSTPSVLGDMFKLYGAYSEGRCALLPPVTGFGDYVAWLRRQDRLQAEQFWRGYLKGFTTPTPLKLVGANRAASEDNDYCDRQFVLSRSITEGLQKLGRERHLTMNTILQGLWALLLGRYSGQREVVFGAVVSGRPAEIPGVETVVGPFINTLPVRVELPSDMPVLEWLGRLQDQQLDARGYQYSSLVEIQGWTAVPRSKPLFESILVFENYPLDRSLQRDGGGGVLVSRTHAAIKNNYPLTLRASLRPELSLNLMYEARRFPAASIAQVFEHIQLLVEALIENPMSNLQTLTSVLAAADRDRESRAKEENRESMHDRLKAVRRKSVSGLRAES